ncbi:hypothetical protein WA026_011948 [Henosepilachna vigintioctopunctata]|uniref:Uncharacterized protein n=1 Tax=Henosepilachna vigintioctopunctata TaxID=420089 RepID=A0AAW1VAV5_9CUCU
MWCKTKRRRSAKGDTGQAHTEKASEVADAIQSSQALPISLSLFPSFNLLRYSIPSTCSQRNSKIFRTPVSNGIAHVSQPYQDENDICVE